MSAIWYRHWLEMRVAIWTLLAIVTLCVPLYALGMFGMSSHLSETGRFAVEISDLVAFAGSTPSHAIVSWSAHIQFLSFLALSLSLLLVGNGISSAAGRGMGPKSLSAFLSLSLPVSRARMLATRTLFALAVSAVMVLLLLLSHVLVLFVSGHPLPIAAMVVADVRTVTVVSTVMALLSFATIVIRESWVGIVVNAVVVLAFLGGWPLLEHFIAGAPWLEVTALLAITGVVVGASAFIAGAKDY